jgi:glyoxylase-like metal-dependent hydrolase (beta-lactamase superfamily II)
MARHSDRVPENADGDFFVDASCIDCDLCRQLAPASFARSERRGQSYVASQPSNDPDRHRVLMALVTCPTSSIGTTRKLDTHAAARAFPEPVADGVYFCGYASERSYGAASWLIVRSGGNVLVDSPRAASVLVDGIRALGGARWMFLTHRDDVADHDKWHARLGCERIAHRADAPANIERVVDGVTDLADDLRIVPVPGHTRGSCVLIYRPSATPGGVAAHPGQAGAFERPSATPGGVAAHPGQAGAFERPSATPGGVAAHPGQAPGQAGAFERAPIAFTGDHVWANHAGDGLEAGRDVCWYSWPEQRRSMAALAEHAFVEVFPGHGRRFRAPDAAAMQRALRRLAAVM